jgi:beta-glucosidase
MKFKTIFGTILLLISLPLMAKQLPYQNAGLSAEQRVDDLIARMTLREKAGQMCQYVGIEHIKHSEQLVSAREMKNSDAYGFYPGLRPEQIPALISKGDIGSFLHVMTPSEANELQSHALQSRLGIPLIIGIDAIHGNGMVSGATIYPSPISQASSFNLDLVRQASIQTAKEMRANGSQWSFTPNVDIVRDPRWGRVGETFGEDPYLVGEMGVATIEGLQQGDFTGDEKVIANAKHFVGGGDPINGLNLSPIDVSERTLRQDYFPPFKRAVDAGVFTFMAAHNEVNGVPSHGNRFLLNDVLREEWTFPGFVVSDWMDIERLKTLHHVVPTQKDAVHLTIDAGMDMHMHGPDFLEPILALVEEGRLSEERIDASVRPILLAKFRLGLFENPYAEDGLAEKLNFNAEHQQTSLAMARQAIVLLKNNDHVLPLAQGQRIFVTGPNANSHAILGDWVLEQPEQNVTTVIEGLRSLVDGSTTLDFLDVGNQVKHLSDAQIKQAGVRAEQADVSIVVVGENPLRYDRKGKTTGENVARAALDLYGRQLELIQAIHQAGKPVIVVLVNGRPISEPWLVENVPAIVEAWEPGSFGGQAIAEVLFGEVNPSGKLPITVPYSAGHIQAIYNHKPSATTKRYVDLPSKNLFEFGFGLSYTQFTYSKPSITKPIIGQTESTEVSITLSNTGKRAGDEIVQLYVNDNYSQVTRPVKELKAFERVHLAPGESKTVSFSVTPEMLAYYNLAMDWVVEPGKFNLMLGSSSRNSDLNVIELSVK